jgi:hypothetical protein
VLLVSVGFFAGATPLLPALADPPSLSGEVLLGNNGTGTSCEIQSSGGGSFTYSVSGTASGPYPGTFTESGSGSWDDTGATFSANFSIDSSAGQVSGTKSSSDIAIGCRPPNGEFFAHRSSTAYTAQIQTAAGTFSDHGATEAELCSDTCRYGAKEWDLTTGQFREEYGPDVRPPTVQAPVKLIPYYKMLGTSSIPVRLRWFARDSSGISRYELQQSSDGGSTYVDVALPSPVSWVKLVNLSPGSARYRFRVRATDSAGNRSAWVAGSVFSVRAFQESDPAVAYSGVWRDATVSTAYGGSLRYSGAWENTSTFSVPAGTDHVAWVSQRSSSRGMAYVYVDGALAASVDLYSATVNNRIIVFAWSLSPSSAHTVQVHVAGGKNASSTGTRVDIDAFVTTN